MNRDNANLIIDALCKYVTSRVAKARKFKANGNASAEILTAIDRADYMLAQAEALKADFETRCDPDTRAFECHRCNLSVEARWEPPSCPECDDPCVPVGPPAPPAQAVADPVPMRQPRHDLERAVNAIKATVHEAAAGLSVTEAIGALELAKLELLKEQEQ